MASARSSGVAAGELNRIYSLGAAGSLTDGQLLERFLSRDDPTGAEAAFSALVDRHGAMVLSICRCELGDLHDANDAFQATFLVLVSKAATIRQRDSVGGWLLGIARRVAARARVEGARRRRHLEQLGIERNLLEEGSAAAAPGEPEVDYTPLFAEVDRLPEHFRAPVVLHYFEGLSTEATAQRLGCARGTVLSRLSRARNRLKRGLEQRGVAPAAFIPAGDALKCLLPQPPVPARLAQGTIRAASSLGLAGAAIESVVPATVAQLARRVVRTLALARVGAAATVFFIAAASLSIGLAAALKPNEKPERGQAMERPRGATEKRQAPAADRQENADPLVLRGRVLDPDGKPAVRAELFLADSRLGMLDSAALFRLGQTADDGRFEVEVPRHRLDSPGGRPVTSFPAFAIAALAADSGPDWKAIDPTKSNAPITLSLRRDDVPVEGRILSLEGRPMSGVSVRPGYIIEIPSRLLEKLRANAGKMNPELWGEMSNGFAFGGSGPIAPVRTGVDGRFRMAGIGRDRVVLVIVEGESIEWSFAMILTSSDPAYKPVLLPGDGSDARRIEGPRFDMAVAPGTVIEGTVRDRDTGRPIAGAKVRSWLAGQLTSDAQGRFRITGQPRGRENVIEVTVEDQSYIKVVKTVKDAQGLGPLRLDIPLKRGVWIEGKVANASSGNPVKAVVVYYPFRDNPHVKDCPDSSFLNNNVSDEVEFPTDANGRFRAVALPAGGILTVLAGEPGYLTARPLDAKTAGNVLHAANFFYQMSTYHALLPIDAPPGKRLVIPDISLTAGRTQHIRIAAPDGRPVAGTRAFCLQDRSLAAEPIAGDEFNFVHANPGKAETLIIVDEGRLQGAKVELKGDEPDPVRVVLQLTGSVTGRLVDEDGKPRAGASLAINYEDITTRGTTMSAERFGPESVGPEGRFRIKGLVSGVFYSVQVIKKNETNYSLRAEGYLQKPQWTIKPGELQDWGDVQVKAYRP